MDLQTYGSKQGIFSCEPYRGTQCKELLGDKYVFMKSNVSQEVIDEKLANAFGVIWASGDLSEQCAMYVKPTLCFSALPICKSKRPPKPDSICRQDCEMLENDICKKEYAIAKRHAIIGAVLNSEDCSVLSSQDCYSLGLPVPEPSNKNERCYRGKGEGYRGEVSKTESGKECIPWNQSNIRTANYTELLGGHNFCRNPDQPVQSKPWCYTYDNNFPLKEACSIPKCEDTMVYHVILASVLLVTMFSILCGCYCRKRRKLRRTKQKETMSTKFEVSSEKTSFIKLNSNSNEGSFKDGQSEMSLVSKPERRHIKVKQFDFNSIQFEEELGEGAFGKVYRGKIIVENGERMLVAIKTLKEDANLKTVCEFEREVELMSELRHANIISLLGVCMSNRLCMLFEHMSNGDLHEYLISHSPRQDVPHNHYKVILEQNDLLDIAIQIASGMEYLCNQHFVHRDLATRNCLVGDDLVVKISDFGLSRDVYSSDYYRVQKSALLPIRWMSPESILYGKFTIESDIWSYGVVLWEIYSYGLQPYYAHNNKDVVDLIRSHQVLTCPEGCPPRMYALMIECWNQVPNRRPQFTEILSRLTQWKNV